MTSTSSSTVTNNTLLRHQERLSPHDDPSSTTSSTNRLRIVFYAFGFFACMIVMELALEGINEVYAVVSSSNTHSLSYTITLFQFGFCFVVPIVVSKGGSLQSFPKSLPQSLPYLSLSAVVFGSTCLATMSIQYVSFPTKVIFKSSKLIPTMLVSKCCFPAAVGETYTLLDYLAASLLCAGTAGYSWGVGTTNATNSSYRGIILLLISVFCDAFTPNIQQRLMQPPPTPLQSNATSSSLPNKLSRCFFPAQQQQQALVTTVLSASELMTNANGVGCILLLGFVILNGSIHQILQSILHYPVLLLYLVVIGMTLATAVFFYTRLIQKSGSVIAVAVATLRKVVTVLLSYIVYPNKKFSAIQAYSTFLVFSGILISIYSKQQKTKQKQKGSLF